VCPIAYSAQFSETMDYFRAILHSEEKSERVLSFTEEVIAVNSANYTAWCYRREVLKAINANLKKELEYATKLGRANPKNYQVWHHRLVIVERLNDASEELAFTAEMLKEDAKNYHSWAHRQWAIEKFSLWDHELEYVNEMIDSDMRNNSAWNQRFFVNGRKLTQEVIAAEIQYAFHYIRKAPNNQSPWVYLKGILRKELFATFPIVKENCLAMKEMYVGCAHVLSLLIDIAEQENTVKSIAEAIELCKPLEERLDVIRVKYWKYRQLQLTEKLSILTPTQT